MTYACTSPSSCDMLHNLRGAVDRIYGAPMHHVCCGSFGMKWSREGSKYVWSLDPRL